MKAADLRTKTPDELVDQLRTLEKEGFNLRFQRASGQLENTARVRQVRRDIARVRTILHLKGVTAPSAAKPTEKPAAKARKKRAAGRK